VTAVDETARIVEVNTGESVRTFFGEGHLGSIRALSLSPDGSILATLENGRLKTWDESTRSLRWSLDVPGGGVSYSPDGALIAVLGGGAIRLVNPRDGTIARTLPNTGDYGDWSPDASRIAVSSFKHTVTVLDAKSGEELLVITGPTGFSAVAWSPD